MASRRVLALLLAMLLAMLFGSAQADPGAARRAQLINLLKEDCGACHGLTLKGGLGPDITPKALQGKPRAMILETILNGRPGTPMPPWKPFMSREEAEWLVNRLYSGDTDDH